MKTICSPDNIYCLANNLPESLASLSGLGVVFAGMAFAAMLLFNSTQ